MWLPLRYHSRDVVWVSWGGGKCPPQEFFFFSRFQAFKNSIKIRTETRLLGGGGICPPPKQNLKRRACITAVGASWGPQSESKFLARELGYVMRLIVLSSKPQSESQSMPRRLGHLMRLRYLYESLSLDQSPCHRSWGMK